VSRIQEEDVTVGVVLPLTRELRGAEVMFADESELQDDWGSQLGFHCVACRINSALPGSPPHSVVLAQPSRTGNNHAAICATRLALAFPALEAVICGGIGGGAPTPGDPERDLHLGDIVLLGADGVLQYDFGKERSNHEGNGYFLDRTRQPSPPGEDFLIIANRLLHLAERGKPPWVSRLHERLPLLTELNPLFARPSDPAHTIYERYVGDRLEAGPRPSPHNAPRLFTGAIGSANRVLKNPRERDRLRDGRPKILAIDMESAGVADACHHFGLPFTTVRGIADYCDGQKKDHWQFYAAAASAAGVYSVIQYLPSTLRRAKVQIVRGGIANNDTAIERTAVQAVAANAHSASSTVNIVENSRPSESATVEHRTQTPELQVSEPVQETQREAAAASPRGIDDYLQAMLQQEGRHDWISLFQRAEELDEFLGRQPAAQINAQTRAQALYQVAKAYTSYLAYHNDVEATEQRRLRQRALELIRLSAEVLS
jgi:nucleoside phosphorylase